MQSPSFSRREFMRMAGAGVGAAALGGCATLRTRRQAARPNVLFMCIDDLNDWTGCLGGHPDARTPNIDRLASQGVLFTNAFCAAPACNPSRTAVLTGVRPSTSGVYINKQPWRENAMLRDAVTMPQHFMAHGYTALGSGKIFHGLDPDPPSWDAYWPSMTEAMPPELTPPKELLPLNGIPDARQFDWGPIDVSNEAMADWQVADWVIEQLHRPYDRPFFLGCGIFRPHLPWYVPREYFDMYPLETLTLPNVKEDDLDDVPPMGRAMARTHDNARVLKYGQWREAVQGYLASITFADACVGRVLDALADSPYAGNTVVVLWSDHGWHLGEKLHWRKYALWEEATHNVLVFAGAGVGNAGMACDVPVSLLDLYSTLNALCGLSQREELEGDSLVPLLDDPAAGVERAVVTTNGWNNHSVRSRDWRYTRYADGGEELYDHRSDPLEWWNLAGEPTCTGVKRELAGWLPKENAPPDPPLPA